MIKDHQSSKLSVPSHRKMDWRLFMRGAENTHAHELMNRPQIVSREDTNTAFARVFVLAKYGRAAEARHQLECLWTDLNLENGDANLKNEFYLVDTHVRIYEDRPFISDTDNILKMILDTLPREDFIGRGLALNLLCIYEFHSGHFDRSQEHAEGAIRFFIQGGAEFGALHLYAHLGQIKLMRGDLEGAAAQYSDMEAKLSNLQEDTSALLAICQALRSEVAYETNHLSESSLLLAGAIQSVEENDAWIDVRAAAYRVKTRLAFIVSGLPGALTELAHCENMALSKNMPRLFMLMQLERIRALTLSGELQEARTIMRANGLTSNPNDWEKRENSVIGQGTSSVAIARWLVHARRSHDALTFLEHAEDYAIRGGQLLSLAKLRVIRAAAHWRLNQKNDATSSLLSALRLLGTQPFRRFILDEDNEVHEVVQAVLDGKHVTILPNLKQRRNLSELTHYWATQSIGKQSSYSALTDDGKIRSKYQKRYLELLDLGHSNKEIAKILGVSPNTVKYHLKLLFKDLGAKNRLHAVRLAQEFGVI